MRKIISCLSQSREKWCKWSAKVIVESSDKNRSTDGKGEEAEKAFQSEMPFHHCNQARKTTTRRYRLRQVERRTSTLETWRYVYGKCHRYHAMVTTTMRQLHEGLSLSHRFDNLTTMYSCQRQTHRYVLEKNFSCHVT